MALLPEDELDHWLNFSASIQSMVAHRPDEFSPDVLMGSVVVSHERLREIGALLGLTETSDEIRTSRSQPPPPERTPPYTFKVGFDIREPFIFERGYGRVTWTHAQVFRDRTNLKLDSPVEFCGYGQVLLRIGSSAFKSLPQRPEVASLVQTFSTWSPDGLQISTMAMARYMIPIRVPAPQEVVNVVLQSRGVGWNLSDKGRIAESIRQTASLGDLLDVGMYEAIRSLTTRRSRQLMKNIQARKHTSSELELAQFVSDIGGRFERLSQHANQIEHVSKQVRVPVLERLVSIGWAEQGCRIVCTSCGITSFIPLAVVDPLATCPGCRRGQQFESTATGVTIFYRLNSLIDRASDQGVLPHLLVQAVLNRADPGSLVLPGIDVNFSDGTRAEVDLFGVFRGKVVAGEVKTSPDDFNSLQLRRDFDLSTRLGVDTHIMAALGELPEEARVEAQRHAKRLRIELMILDNKDLRPTVALLSANGR